MTAARFIAITLVWGLLTSVAAFALPNRTEDTPRVLEVLTVAPAHATAGPSDSDTGDAVRRAQAQHEANVNTLQAAALEEAARKATTTTTVVRRAAPRPAPVAPRNLGGDCNAWLAAAGVQDTASALALIARESGCNAYAVNRSSGACNVAQELPCGKSGCALGDGACSVRWMNGYVISRYGSWANALAFQIANNWY